MLAHLAMSYFYTYPGRTPDVRLTPRRGLLVIRRGKGLKHRAVPLVLEVREPLQDYLEHRRALADLWTRKGAIGLWWG